MPSKRSVVKVRILGDEYSINTDASSDHARSVAEHVDKTIRSILDSASTMETQKATILALLQITDELFQERASTAALVGDLRQLAADIRPLLPPAKRGEELG